MSNSLLLRVYSIKAGKRWKFSALKMASDAGVKFDDAPHLSASGKHFFSAGNAHGVGFPGYKTVIDIGFSPQQDGVGGISLPLRTRMMLPASSLSSATDCSMPPSFLRAEMGKYDL